MTAPNSEFAAKVRRTGHSVKREPDGAAAAPADASLPAAAAPDPALVDHLRTLLQGSGYGEDLKMRTGAKNTVSTLGICNH